MPLVNDKTKPTGKVERSPEIEQLIDEISSDISKKALDKVKEWAEPIIETKRKFTPAMGFEEEKTKAYQAKQVFTNLIGPVAVVPRTAGESDVLKGMYAMGMRDDDIRALAGIGLAIFKRMKNMPLDESVRKAMGETTGSTGGFLIPYEFRPELLRLVIEKQVVRPRAQVVAMANNTLLYPRISDTTHVSSIHGGIRGTWSAEATALGTGDPALGQMQLIAKKFDDSIPVSNELLMDSPISLAPLLGVLLREGLGFFEDCDMISGLGAGRPLGYLASPALIAVARTSAGHILIDDVINLQSRLFPSSYDRAVWVCSPGALVDIWKMSMVVGMGGSAVMISNVPGQTAAQPWPFVINGRPLIVSEKVPTLGVKGDISLCDFGYYIIGDRMELSIESSPHARFESDQTVFRAIERLDGAPWINSPLIPANSGPTLSAFVTVAT